MSSGIVKRARGRPPKSKNTIVMTPNKIPALVPLGPAPESNRKSGRMSLRPNRKVKLFKGDPDDFSDDSEDIHEPVDDDVADPLAKFEVESGDEEDEDLIPVSSAKKPRFSTSILGEDEINELMNRDVQDEPRRSRKMVLYNPKLAAAQRKRELDKTGQESASTKIDLLKSTYNENRDCICAGCSMELDPNKLHK